MIILRIILKYGSYLILIRNMLQQEICNGNLMKYLRKMEIISKFEYWIFSNIIQDYTTTSSKKYWEITRKPLKKHLE